MRKFRTLDEFEEEYFRKHPEEIDDYLTEIFQEYAEDNDYGALSPSAAPSTIPGALAYGITHPTANLYFFIYIEFFSPTYLNEFIIKSKKVFSRKAIEEFAHNQNRHPGIILGRLHYDKLVTHKNLRQLLVKVSPILGYSTDNFCNSKFDIPQIAEVPTNDDD
ncbi:hypothetical protein [Nostoc sp.]